MVLIGATVFGIILGYLSWHAVLPGEKSVSLKTVAAFIGIVGGAAVTALFPSGSELFGGYCIGLGVGFFASPVRKWISDGVQRLIRYRELRTLQENKALQAETKRALQNWSSIEEFVRERLARHVSFIDVDELEALPYSYSTKVFVMKEYARRNVKAGVRFVTSSFGPWLVKF